MSLSPGARLGPYEVVAPAGAGGMGEVYRARDTRLGRTVALKVLPPGLATDPERLQRFEHEAKLLSTLSHPNILSIHDVGAEKGVPYLVSEFLEGETLRQRLERGPLGMRRLIDHAVQIASGLAAAHGREIVHRDLKPENIFVTRDERIKILDFGLAKQLQAIRAEVGESPTMALSHTAAGTVMGTVGYMSPEQVRGQTADHRSDIFSLGAVLYEMAAARRAFQRETGAETMSAILKEEPPDLASSGAHVPPALERIISRCLEKAPERRFQSASDLAFAVEALSGGTSVSVQAGAPPRRRRWLAIASAALLLIVLASAALLLRQREPPGEVTYTVLNFRPETIFRAAFAPDGQTILYSAAIRGNTPAIFTIRSDYPEGRSTGLPRSHLLRVSTTGELALLTNAEYVAHRMFEGTLARMPAGAQMPREILERVRDADWSPEGDLAIVREVDGRDRLEYPIGTVLYETSGYVSDPRFSPDGSRIAFLEHPFRFDNRGVVSVVDLQGRRTVLTGEFWGEEGLAWSPDGREILFSAGTGFENFFVQAVDLSGRVRMALTSAGGLTLHDAAPNGRWLVTRDDVRKRVFARVPGAEEEVDLAWLDLSSAVLLAPDAGRLFFSEQSGALGANYATCVRETSAGSGVVQLGAGVPADVTSDGRWIAALVPDAPPRIALYPTGPGEARHVTAGLDVYDSANFLPGGRGLLVCGTTGGKPPRCYTHAIDGGTPHPVSPEGTNNGVLSPDGSRFVASGRNGYELYTLGAEHPPTPLPFLHANDRVFDWSTDGRAVYAHRWGAVPSAIERVDVQTGLRTVVHRLVPSDTTGVMAVQTASITPDERWYAYEYRVMTSRFFMVQGAR